MSEALHFERIGIRRMPGFDWDAGFEIGGLGPGVNILFGPNGSGKSTTASAIEHLLWPDSAKGIGAHLFADISLGGRSIQASIEGPLGARFVPEQPATCANDGRARYQFPLDQLLIDTGARFAEDLTSQMSGGYSIQTALHVIDKASALGGPTSLRNRLDDQREAYKKAENKQSDIAAAESDLPELAKRLESAEVAETRAKAISEALDYRDAVERWLAALRTLHSLDRHAANVREGDLASAKSVQDDVLKAREALSEAHGELCRHTPSGAWSRLKRPVPAGLHASLAALCGDLRSADATVRSKGEALAAATGLAEEALRELAKYPGAEKGTNENTLLTADIEDLQRLSIEEEAARAARSQYLKLREVLGVDDREPGLAIGESQKRGTDLSKACVQLAAWLSEGVGASSSEVARAANVGRMFVAVAAIGALVGLVQPWIGVVIAALAVVGYFVVLTTTPQASTARQKIEASFPMNGIDGPTEWEAQNVQARIDALLDEIGAQKELQARLSRWSAVRSDAEQADREWQRLESQRLDKANEYGLTFASGAQSLAHLVGVLNRALSAQARVHGAGSELKQVQNQRDLILHTISAHLASYGYPIPESFVEAERLCARLSDWEKADLAWKAGWKGLSRARVNRKRFYNDLGLRVGDDETLRQWVAQAKLYADAVADAKAKRQALRRAREITPRESRREPTESLIVRRDAATHEAEAARDLRDAIRDRQKDAAAARHGNDLGEALDSVHAAEAALVDHRQARKALRIRQLVADAVARELRASTVPEVFQEARRLFMRVTNNEYALTFDPEANTFGAEYLGRPVGLDGLSKGTRVQALLAVRLAWVIRQEVGPRLPILLDETLANCDEARSNAIMDVVAELCADRQVFYCTAQADELIRWKERLGEDRVTVIDMMAARKRAAAALPTRRRVDYGHTVQFSTRVPAPGDLDHEAYGRALNVVAIDPAKPVDALHVWHFLTETRRVYELACDNLVTWGAIKETCELRDPKPLSTDEFRLAEARAAGIEAACRCWMSDKAQARIDPDALGYWLGSRVIRDPVLQRASECRWDAGALITSLRSDPVARFAKGSIDDLHTWCVGRGYAAAGEAVGVDDAFERVIEAINRFAPGEIDASEIRAILARVGYYVARS